MTNWRKMTRNFLNESTKPTIRTYLQTIEELLGGLNLRTQRGSRNVEMIRHNIKEVRKMTRSLENKISVLEEQVKVLEETKLREGDGEAQ
jgi:hypothetical protein